MPPFLVSICPPGGAPGRSFGYHEALHAYPQFRKPLITLHAVHLSGGETRITTAAPLPCGTTISIITPALSFAQLRELLEDAAVSDSLSTMVQASKALALVDALSMTPEQWFILRELRRDLRDAEAEQLAALLAEAARGTRIPRSADLIRMTALSAERLAEVN